MDQEWRTENIKRERVKISSRPCMVATDEGDKKKQKSKSKIKK